MKGIIVINGYSKTEGIMYQVKRLSEEFNNRNVEIEVKKTTELLCYIENGDIKSNLCADFIVYLDKDPHIALMLERLGYRLFNSREAIEICDDKIRTHIMLSNQGINMPTTISSPLMYYVSEDKFYSKILEVLDFPIVVKEAHGSLGGQVYLCNNIEELKDTREKLKLKPHLYQEFIKASSGKDTRVIVIGKKVIAAYNRVSKSDFRSNIELGGTGEQTILTKSFIDMAERVATILNLDYCGIDILSDNGNPVLCEVNSNAFFTGAEKYTGANIAKEYVDYILKVMD